MKLDTLPEAISKALKRDGAIRIFDGRWSDGYVDRGELQRLVDNGTLGMQRRHGMAFAIMPPKRTPGTRGPLKGQGGAPKKQPEERRIAINARVAPETKKALAEMMQEESLGAVIDRLVKAEIKRRAEQESARGMADIYAGGLPGWDG